MRWYAFQRADWDHIIHSRWRAGWFVCRYGSQDMDKVRKWTVREIEEAAEHLGFFIEQEAPKPGSSPGGIA